MTTNFPRILILLILVSIFGLMTECCGSSTWTYTGTTGTASGGGGNTGGGGGTTSGDAFGTVTQSSRVPGDMSGKGSSSDLSEGGYMKFDLRNSGKSSVSSAYLKLYVKSWTGNPWRWIVVLSNDPTLVDPSVTFQDIETHSNVGSGVVTLQSNGWLNIPLSGSALYAINTALANGDPNKRWAAFSLGFE